MSTLIITAIILFFILFYTLFKTGIKQMNLLASSPSVIKETNSNIREKENRKAENKQRKKAGAQEVVYNKRNTPNPSR
jgi:hypothetical protein